jgi:hypothetical protein
VADVEGVYPGAGVLGDGDGAVAARDVGVVADLCFAVEAVPLGRRLVGEPALLVIDPLAALVLLGRLAPLPAGPSAATALQLVPADDAVPAFGAVASLTLNQVAHVTPGLRVVLNPRRRYTHDSPSYQAMESGEVRAQINSEQFVHGLPLSGEREPPKCS